MIIGHGDIAKVLTDREDRIYFAAGVSNSQEVRESEYQREIDLLLKQNKIVHLVYFGSLCIFYSNTRYSKHKRYMERLVKSNFKHYTIMRLGNINWGNNPHTIINVFRNRIRNDEPCHIWNDGEYRYIINKDDFLHWIDVIPPWNCEINVEGVRMTVLNLYLNLIREKEIYGKVKYSYSFTQL